jgi:hypothetical protein
MTGRTRPSRGAGPPAWAASLAPGATTCQSCGQVNDPGARVCRSCGLPVSAPGTPLRGVATRVVELPSERGASLGSAIGLVAVVLVLVVASVLVLGGGTFLSGGGQVIVAGDPASIDPNLGPGGDGPIIGPGGEIDPSPDASAFPTPPAETRLAFTCEGGAIGDPTLGSWRVTRFQWGARDNFDRVTFSLEREGDAARGTRVAMEWMRPAEAAERFGVERPKGARALVLAFQGPMTIRSENLVDGGLRAVRSVDVRMGRDDVLRAIVGVRGEGCARLRAPDWEDNGTGSSARLLLDIRRR